MGNVLKIKTRGVEVHDDQTFKIKSSLLATVVPHVVSKSTPFSTLTVDQCKRKNTGTSSSVLSATDVNDPLN